MQGVLAPRQAPWQVVHQLTEAGWLAMKTDSDAHAHHTKAGGQPPGRPTTLHPQIIQLGRTGWQRPDYERITRSTRICDQADTNLTLILTLAEIDSILNRTGPAPNLWP